MNREISQDEGNDVCKILNETSPIATQLGYVLSFDKTKCFILTKHNALSKKSVTVKVGDKIEDAKRFMIAQEKILGEDDET
jgi:hypothetical protein